MILSDIMELVYHVIGIASKEGNLQDSSEGHGVVVWRESSSSPKEDENE
jgi:hypothetical protein